MSLKTASSSFGKLDKRECDFPVLPLPSKMKLRYTHGFRPTSNYYTQRVLVVAFAQRIAVQHKHENYAFARWGQR